MAAAAPAQISDWQDDTVAGVAVRVFDPPRDGGSAGPPGGVVWLPDFDALTPETLPGWDEPLRRRGVRTLCALPGPTWWLDRPDPAFEEGEGRTPWRWLIEALAPYAAERFGGPIAWAGAGAGGQAALRAGFRRHGTPPKSAPAVWAYAPAVALEAVHGRGSTLDGLFPDSPERKGSEQARVASVLTDVNPLGRPQRLRIACDPGEVWFSGCDLLADKLRSGGVPLETEFEPRSPADRESVLNAAGPAAVGLLADALTFAV